MFINGPPTFLKKMCYANSMAANKLKEFDVLGFVGEYHRLIDEDDRTILIAEDSAVDRTAAGRIGTRQPQ